MRERKDERSLHAFLERNEVANEQTPARENPLTEERFLSLEQFRVDEEQEREDSLSKPSQNASKSSASGGMQVQRLTQYLSTVAVLTTATATVAFSAGASATKPPPVVETPPPAPPVVEEIPPPSFTLRTENVSYDGYQCTLQVSDTGAEYTLVLEVNGDKIVERSLQGQEEYAFSAEDLESGQSYDLRVFEGEKEMFSYAFTTDPIVYFGETREGRTYFTLHEDISFAYDVGLLFFGENGEDYSSLTSYDLLGESYIYTDALYAGEYFFELHEYLPEDVERVQMQTVTLGALTPLRYEAMVVPLDSSMDAGWTLTLVGESGDMAPYALSYIELQNTRDESDRYTVALEDLMVNDNLISAILPQESVGEYTVRIFGSCMDGEYEIEAPVWVGEITIG